MAEIKNDVHNAILTFEDEQIVLFSDLKNGNLRRMTAEERIQYALDEMARAEQFREDRSYIIDCCKNLGID